MRTLAQVLRLLPTSPETGLPAEQAEFSRRQFGSNQLTPLPRTPAWQKFLEKFDEPIIKILLAAALLSMFVDLFNMGETAVAGTALAVAATASKRNTPASAAHRWFCRLRA